MPAFAVNAMPVVAGNVAQLAPVAAIPVYVVSDGSVAVSKVAVRPVVEVAAGFPRASVTPIPVVYPGGSPAIAPVAPIPIFVVGTVP